MAELIFESKFNNLDGVFWQRHEPQIVGSEIKMHVDRTLDHSPERADVLVGDWIDKDAKEGVPLPLPYGEEVWVGYRFRIPDWIPDNPNLGSLIFQLKGLWDAAQPSDHPFLPLYVEEDNLLFVSRNPADTLSQVIGKISNNPVDIVIRMNAHLTDGYFDIWKDGELVWNYEGPTYKHTRNYYIAFGPYVWYWKPKNADQPFNKEITTRTVYFDQMRVAVGADGYDLVNPSQTLPDPEPDGHDALWESIAELQSRQAEMSVKLLAQEASIEDLAQFQDVQNTRIGEIEKLLKIIAAEINTALGE